MEQSPARPDAQVAPPTQGTPETAQTTALTNQNPAQVLTGQIPAAAPVAPPVGSAQSQSPPASSPNFTFSAKDAGSRKLSFSLKWILIPVVLFLIIGGIGGGAFYFVSSKKSEIKTSVEEQIQNFSNLEATYTKVVNLIRDVPEAVPTAETQRLLGVSDTQEVLSGLVLGLEDDPAVVQNRQLTEYYRQGKANAGEISRLNGNLKKQFGSFPGGFLFPEPGNLFSDTEKFTINTIDLLNYLEAVNRLSLEVSTWGYEVGFLIGQAVELGPSEEIISSLDEKINELNKMKVNAAKIEASTLTPELQQEHSQLLEEFDTIKESFDKILASIKARDLPALLAALESLLFQAAAASETGQVESVSFWQNDLTILSVKDVKKDWQHYLEEF